MAQELEPKKHKRQLRNHAHASLDKEAAALDQVLSNVSSGGIVIIPRLLPAFKAALGKNLSLSTLYRMLARHGWRKLAPDTVHPQGDPERCEDFKKTLRQLGAKSEHICQEAAFAPDISGRVPLWTNQRLLLLLGQAPIAANR